MVNSIVDFSIHIIFFYQNSVLSMCIGVVVPRFLIMVHCQLPTSKPMGNSRETSNVTHWVLVPILVEVLRHSLSGNDTVPLCNGIQSRTVHLHWIALDDDDSLDTFYGNENS